MLPRRLFTVIRRNLAGSPGKAASEYRRSHMPSATQNIKVLAFAGSLRQGSFNRSLVRAAQELAPPNVTMRIFDLASIPLYNGDVEAAGVPEGVTAFKKAIHDSDGLLIATPEYNHGVPGVMK